MPADLNTELRAFHAAFARYTTYNRRGVGWLLEQRGRRLRWRVWKEFKGIAKTAAELRAEIKSAGFGIKRRIDPDTGKPVSLKDEIRARVKSRNFLSASFLYKAWRAGREGKSKRFTSRSRGHVRIGDALVNTLQGKPNPFVSIASYLQGVVAQDRNHRIAAKSMRAETADIGVYLARKHKQQIAREFNRTFIGRISMP